MKKVALFNMLVILAMILVACTPAATPTPAPTAVPTKPPAPTAVPLTAVPPTVAPTKVPATAAPTAAPTATPLPTKFVLSITLNAGLKWSDGSALTTKDIVCTYDIRWLQNNVVWTYINKITPKDDLNIDFELNDYGWRPQYMILRQLPVYPCAGYKDFADKAAALRAKGAPRTGDEMKALTTDFNNYKPTDYIVSGPYKIDPKSITEAQLTLVKNPNGFNASKIDFDKMLVYYGETNQAIPLVQAGQVDYATHGFLPANVASFINTPGVQIRNGLVGAGVGFWFNFADPVLAKKEVRQAFAYIIDRDENGKVTYGDGTKGIKIMAGMPDEIVSKWLTPEVIAKLNPYAKDWTKAEQLLTQAGLKKAAGGWQTADGKTWNVELSAPSDWADVLASAQNAADQLKKFGINASVRGYQSSERSTVQKEGKYQILMDFGMLYNVPHPYRGFEFPLIPPNNNPSDKTAPGMGFPVVQKGPDGKDYDVTDLIRQSNLGFDVEKQKGPLGILAQIINDQLPYFAFWVRYGNDPINVNNVSGWLPQSDKVYQNAQGGDNYAAIQFLGGTLKPTTANKNKIFQTVWPYTQPPKYHYNLYVSGDIDSLGAFVNPSQFPPLFWYMWADDKYVPVMAASYKLTQK